MHPPTQPNIAHAHQPTCSPTHSDKASQYRSIELAGGPLCRPDGRIPRPGLALRIASWNVRGPEMTYLFLEPGQKRVGPLAGLLGGHFVLVSVRFGHFSHDFCRPKTEHRTGLMLRERKFSPFDRWACASEGNDGREVGSPQPLSECASGCVLSVSCFLFWFLSGISPRFAAGKNVVMVLSCQSLAWIVKRCGKIAPLRRNAGICNARSKSCNRSVWMDPNLVRRFKI